MRIDLYTLGGFKPLLGYYLLSFWITLVLVSFFLYTHFNRFNFKTGFCMKNCFWVVIKSKKRLEYMKSLFIRKSRSKHVILSKKDKKTESLFSGGASYVSIKSKPTCTKFCLFFFWLVRTKK